jgi:hypothetical protein
MASGISLFSLIFSTKLFMLSIFLYSSMTPFAEQIEAGMFVSRRSMLFLPRQTNWMWFFIQPIEMLPIVEATVKIDLL